MPSAVSRRERKLVKCMYFYKQSANSPAINFAVLTDDGKYAEFSFVNQCEKLGVSIIRKMKSLFLQFQLDKNSDITFSEEFSRHDGIRFYFELIRDHMKFRVSTLKLKKVIRGIVWRHPRSAMSKREIELKKRGTHDPHRIGVERFNKVWSYLVQKKRGIQCPWITEEVGYWLQNKSESLAKKHKHMRLAMYYLALKNDWWGIEALRDKHYKKVTETRAKLYPKVELAKL